MVKYSCEKCGKDFTQKGHYTKHATKKNPCVFESKIEEMIEKVVVKKINEIQNILIENVDDVKPPVVMSTEMSKNDETTKEGKKMKGQFYTVNSSYILDGLSMPPKSARCVIEPFAGKGDLLEWAL